jgi:parallel beta-helix repeat protein
MVNSIGTIVEGNHIVDCATVTESALWVHVSQGVVIANNVIDGGSVLLAQIRVSSSTDCTVLGNVCNNSLGAGIIGAGCERLAITGNSVVAPVNGGILTDSGCWGVTIASNLVKGSGTGGIYSAGGHYNIITGNIIEDCYDNGIDIGASTDVTIVGNTIRGIKKALEGLGICLNGNSGIVANNIIEFCALNGILVGGSNSDLRIVNNIVKNCRQDTIPAYPVEAGIAVHGYSNLLCTGILVQGNRVFDDQAGTSLLTADPAPGQKVVVVADGTQFKVYQAVTISDDTPDTEDNIIQSISGNTLTMRTNLAHTYTMAQNAVVNGRQTQDYGIGIQNDGGGTIIGVQVCDNDLDGNILGGILLTLSGGTTDAKIYRNRGYVTENSGNFTVVAGAWGVSVNHGLSTNATSVTLGLTSNCTTGVYVLPPITTTAFSVNLTALQGTNITGYWRAVVGAGN